jgi:(p)ppGpp synthase/HD superfamily hydrolase
MENNNTTSSSTNNSNQQTAESYLEPCEYTTRLINKLKSLNTSSTLDFNLINKAIHWARKYHGQQMRKSGEPYYTHPLEVAYLIAEHTKPTTNTIVVSILHDIIEDTEVTAGMILDNFGWRIAEMTDALTRDRPDGTKLSVEEILYNAIEKDDKEVLLIKVMDRVHNIMTIGSMSNEKQRKIALETLENFVDIILYHPEITNTLVAKCQSDEAKQNICDSEFIRSLLDYEDSHHILSLGIQNEIMPKHKR